MKYIECKAQWLARPLTTKTSMSGFEGPAANTALDDGFGVPVMKGMITSGFSCFFEETDTKNNCPVYDGTINIPNTPANRYKIAQHVRSRELRVKDRNMERQILAENPKVAKIKQPKNIQHFVDMPDDFDGSKVIIRSGSAAMVDEDPIEDAHAQVSDGDLTEVSKETDSFDTETEVPVKSIAPASVAQVQAHGVPKAANEPPKGFDAKAIKARAEASKAPAQETNTAEADKAKE